MLGCFAVGAILSLVFVSLYYC